MAVQAKVIFITGISSGFGKAIAGYLAHRGHKVYGTVRNKIPVDGFAIPLYMDLTDRNSILSAVEQVILKEGKIDVLINNANMHLAGPVECTPAADIARQMDTGFNGVAHLIQAILPIMRKQGEGLIINISSIGGLMGLPFQAFYSAAKFAIEGMSEALRMELKPYNIKVVVVNPGDFNTSNTANRKKIADSGSYNQQFLKTLAIIEQDETGGWKAEILARKLCKIVESHNPKYRYIVGAPGQKLAVWLKRILPEIWFERILQSHYRIQ